SPRLSPSVLIAVMLLLLLAMPCTTFADSATWKMSPATGDWNHAANWTPPTIPNGPSDTATFAASNTIGVSLSANTEVNGIVFNPSASAFTITAAPTLRLTISGTGITNNSEITQNFVVDAADSCDVFGYVFTNTAPAGTACPASRLAGFSFFPRASADHGHCTDAGSAVSGGVGVRTFLLGSGVVGIASTAARATVIDNGGTVTNAGGGSTELVGSLANP